MAFQRGAFQQATFQVFHLGSTQRLEDYGWYYRKDGQDIYYHSRLASKFNKDKRKDDVLIRHQQNIEISPGLIITE